MNIQIVSDIHLESDRKKDFDAIIKPKALTLVLAGDICPVEDLATWTSFLLWLKPRFKRAFFVYGNHELYSKDTPAYELKRDFENIATLVWDQFHILDDVSMVIDDVCFIGSTLWSHIPAEHGARVKCGIRDFRKIHVRTDDDDKDAVQPVRTLEVRDVNQWHEKHVQFIGDEMKRRREECKKFVVITHHAPLCTKTSHPKYENDRVRSCNYAFSSDQSALLELGVHTWIFGHTHFACDFTHKECRVISNPRGYTFDRTEYNEQCVVQV